MACCKPVSYLDVSPGIATMGRKDANSTHSAPVDTYRKQIGKHDYNKEKRKLKAAKAAADLKKSSSPVKDTVMVLITGLLLIGGLYVGLYWYLNKELPR
ncbi:triple QxxK/R motif-containing protein-like [Dreissena polymorpha]|nr:triple QxxK/R motif-containing protein-like [Dreissena polymorpha]